MVANHSLLMYFSEAGLVVKTVMLILFFGSLTSWTYIIQRGLYLKRTTEDLKFFEEDFWSGSDLNEFYMRLNAQDETHVGLYGIFYSGFREYLRLKKQRGNHSPDVMDGVQRAMRIAYTKEVDQLEQHLPFLASVGSISPYIGLFGTVWGIMGSMQALGSAQQASIAMVAPGISEALVATALGLFAAIPALLAYNRYVNKVEKICNQYERFQEELSAILQRQ